jgi:hypothetical protein
MGPDALGATWCVALCQFIEEILFVRDKIAFMNLDLRVGAGLERRAWVRFCLPSASWCRRCP